MLLRLASSAPRAARRLNKKSGTQRPGARDLCLIYPPPGDLVKRRRVVAYDYDTPDGRCLLALASCRGGWFQL